MPRTERLASNLKKFSVNYEANLSTLATHLRSTFFKTFPKTVRDTTNQSIRIVFQHKFTIKPVIICVLFQATLEHYHGSPQLLKKFARRLDKTTNCIRSTFFTINAWVCTAKIYWVFLRSSSFDLPFRKGVFSF